MAKKPKTVEVTYLESGSFQGGEEDVYNAGIKLDEECVVMSKKTFAELAEKAWKYDELG
jgi:hypothetical protein